MEADKIIIKYGLDLEELKREIAEVKKQLGQVATTAQTSATQTQNSLNKVGDDVKGKLTGAFKTLGGVIAAAFTVQQIGAFISESITLATQVQEVKSNFDKLNNPYLLQNLRKATGGTLSDLKLMGTAVKADKLQIPLQKLGTIFQFAKLRADELGTSTEQLADTLIQGIGVKSTRALVQVGISQEEFAKEVKLTGDYFEALEVVMDRSLKSAGEGFESVADKQERLRANIENTKAELGGKMLPVLDLVLNKVLEVTKAMGYLIDPKGAALGIINEKIAKRNLEQLEAQLSVNQREMLSIKASNQEIEKAIELGIGKYDSDISRYKALKLQNQEIEKAINFLKQEKESTDDATVSTEKLTTATVKNEKAKEKVRTLGDAYIDLAKALATVDPEFEKYIDDLLKANRETTLLDLANGRLERSAVRRNEAVVDSAITLGDVVTDTRTETEKALDALDTYGQAWMELIDSVNAHYQKGSEYRQSLLEQELKNGQISQGQFDRSSAELKKKEAEREKAFSIISIIYSTARAVMAALASSNPVLAVLAGITGAVQLGTVVSTPIPAFKKGVVDFKGKGTGTSDENLVMISNRESIITAKGTLKHKAALEAINKDRFDQYLQKVYLKKDAALKQSAANSDTDYREYLELKRLGYINRNGFSDVVRELKTFKQGLYR